MQMKRVHRHCHLVSVSFLCAAFVSAWCVTARAVVPADASRPVRPGNWALVLDVSGSLDAVDRSALPLRLGVRPGATDAFDLGMDAVAPPAPPDERMPVAALRNETHRAGFRSLAADLRAFPTADLPEIEWHFTVRNGAPSAWSLSWDVSSLPRYWSRILLVPGDATEPTLDMRDVASVSIPGADPITFAPTAVAYTVRVSSVSESSPVLPPAAARALLRAGSVIGAEVPASVFDGLPLTIRSEPVVANPTEGLPGPNGLDLRETLLMRRVRLFRDGVELADLPEPIVLSFFLDKSSPDDSFGGTIGRSRLYPFTITPNGVVRVLRVVDRDTDFVSFAVPHLSIVGLGVSEVDQTPTLLNPLADVVLPDVGAVVRIDMDPAAGDPIFVDDRTAVEDLVYTAAAGAASIDVLAEPTFDGSVLVLAPSGVRSGDASVTVTATDGDGPGVTTTFTASVTALLIDPIDLQPMQEDQEPRVLTVAAPYDSAVEFVDPPGTSDPGVSASIESVGTDTAELTLTVAPNFFTDVDPVEITITATATDGSSQSDTKVFLLEVTPVNDPPTVTSPDGTSLNVVPGRGRVIPLAIEDVDSDTFTIDVPAPPRFGTIAVPTLAVAVDDAAIVYKADASAVGSDSVSVIVRDSERAPSEQLDLNFLFEVPNAPPVAAEAQATTRKSTPVDIPLTGTDPEGNALIYVLASPPANGVTAVNGNIVTYTPNPGFQGIDAFAYTVGDGALTSPPAFVRVLVENTAPTAVAVGPFSVRRNTTGELPLDGEDSDGDPLTYEIATAPSNGSATLDGLAVTYTPAEDFVGEDAFAFTVTDGEVVSDPVIVRITVGNAPPEIASQDVETEEDTPLASPLGASDPDGDPVIVRIIQPPENGTARVEEGALLYRPASQFSGTDLVIVRAFDGIAVSAPAEVRITVVEVADPPVLNIARVVRGVRVSEGAPARTADLAGTNPLFTDPDSDVLFNAASSDPGVVAATVSGSILTLEFLAPGIAEVTVGAEGTDEVASLVVTVEAEAIENVPPVARRPEPQTGVEGEPLLFSVEADDDDADDLTFTVVEVAPTGPEVTVDNVLRQVTFLVDDIPGLAELYRVDLTVSDDVNDPVLFSAIVLIESANLPPVIDAEASVEAGIDTPVEVVVRVSDQNDTDTITLRVAVAEREADILAGAAPAIRAFNTAEVALDDGVSTKTFTLQPTDALAGRLVTLRWTATDGLATVSETTRVLFGENVNLPPTLSAIPDQTVPEGGSLRVDISAEDPEGADLTLAATGLAGAAFLATDLPAIIWEDIGFGRAGAYTFSVIAIDDAGLRATVSFRVTVEDVNRPPELSLATESSASGAPVPGSLTVQQRVPSTFGFAASDPDPSDRLVLEVTGVPTWVRVRRTENPRAPRAVLQMEPPITAEGFTFRVLATDGGGLQVERAVRVDVEAAPNEPPLVEPILPVTVVEGEVARFGVLAVDPDGDALTISATPLPDDATFAAREFDWDVPRGAARTDPYVITVKVDDDRGGVVERLARVLVAEAPNRPPVLGDLPDVDVNEDEQITVELLAGASDPDDDPLTVTFETAFLPAFIDFTPETGALTFRPTEGAEEGFFPVAVRLTDGRGGEVVTTFLLTLNSEEGPIEIRLAIRTAFVTPKEGTPANEYRFAAIVQNPGGDTPDSVRLRVTGPDGFLQELAMSATGEGDVARGAAYDAQLRLGEGDYEFEVIATVGAEVESYTDTGPSVIIGDVEIGEIVVSGTTGAIRAAYALRNPNPGRTVDSAIDYRLVGTDGWRPASVAGDVAGLRTGGQRFAWFTGQDVPDATGEAYELRVTIGEVQRLSPAFNVANVAPATPVLDPIEPSAEPSIIVTGVADPGVEVLVRVGATDAGGSITAEEDGTFRLVTSDLSAGEYPVRAVASAFGLRSETSAPVTAVADLDPPIVRIISPERSSAVPTLEPVVSFAVEFGLSGGNPDDVAVAIDAAAAPASFSDGVFTVSGLRFPDGRVVLVTVRARKLNGLSTTQAWTFQVSLAADDTTSPEAASFNPKPDATISEPLPRIRFSVRDGETAVDPESIQVSVNGETIGHQFRPSDERGGIVLVTLTAPLSEGPNEVTATFADASGTVDKPANERSAGWTFIVDTTPPDPPTFRVPAPDGPAITNVSPFVLEGDTEPGAEVVVIADGRPAGSVTAAEDGTWVFPLELETDGLVAIRLRARDGLGNVSDPSDTAAVMLDATGPRVRLVSPTLGAPTPNLEPVFEGAVLDQVSGVDPTTLSLTVNGEPLEVPYDPALGTFSAPSLAPFESGVEVPVALTVADLAGNTTTLEGTVAFDSRLADVTPPAIVNPRINDVELAVGSQALVAVSTATVVFAIKDDVSGVADVLATLDGAELSVALDGDTVTLDLPGLEEGAHVLLVGAEDVAGNRSDVLQFDFVVDSVTPTPVIEVPELTNQANIVLSGVGNDDDATVTVSVNGVPVETFMDASFRTAVVTLQEGANVVTAAAVDAVGNSAEAEPRTVVLDTAPPRLSFLSPVADSRVPATTATIVINVDDALPIDPTSVLLSVDGVPVTATLAGDTIEYVAPTPFEASTTEAAVRHFAVVSVRDVAGNDASLGASFFVDGVPPRIEVLSPFDGEIVPNTETLVSANIFADDIDPSSVDVRFGIDGDVLVSVLGLPNFDYSVGVGQAAYAPDPLEDGATYRTVVSAADVAGNRAETTWTFTVDTTVDDMNSPGVVINFPQPGDSIGDSGLDNLNFTIGDSGGVDSVDLLLNDPNGSNPVSLDTVVANGSAFVDWRTGRVRVLARRFFVPFQLRGGGFSLDPLELNALERSLSGGGGASFDPLELNALERSLSDGAGGADVGSLENSLASSSGLLGIGTNTIGVATSDVFGNVSFAEWSFDVALEPPSAPVLTVPSPVVNTRSMRITGHVPDLVAGSPFPVTVVLRVNGQSAGLVEVNDAAGAFTLENIPLADGSNELTATAQDDAGNLSDRSETLTIDFDGTPPTVSVDALPSGAASDTVTITGTATDDRSDDFVELVLVVNGADTILTNKQGPFSGTATLTDGENTIVVRAVDAAGNQTESPSVSISLDVLPPTTAPESVSALPTADARGVALSWAADPDADSYVVYRSAAPFTDASALTPLASDVTTAAYTDTTVTAGQTVYYAVASADAAGNSDPGVISPLLNVALIKEAGGAATLADGTSLALPRGALFSNVLLAGTVVLALPDDLPALQGGVTGSARDVLVRSSSGDRVTSFNLPAALTLPVPAGVQVSATSPMAYRLDDLTWTQIVAQTESAARTVAASIQRSAVFQLAQEATTPWDVTGDGTVNIIDLVSVAQLFGSATTGPADVNGDGLVNIIDLATVASHFGESTPAAAAAPVRIDPTSPVASVILRSVPSEPGARLHVVEIHADVVVGLAGYEFTVGVDAAAVRLRRVDAGELFGEQGFWVPLQLSATSAHVGAVRMDLRNGHADESSAGVLATLYVRTTTPAQSTASVIDAIRLRGIRLSDAEGRLLRYRLDLAPIDGPSTLDTALMQNYPNPFNPETWIPFSLADASRVRVSIYSALGGLVRDVDLGRVEPGEYTSRARAVHWDGRNDEGELVASGVYFYRLEAGTTFSQTRRLLILK